METRIDEIADGIYRLSTFIPRSRRPPASPSTSSWCGRRAAAVPLRPARACSRWCRGGRQDRAGREAALDHVRPRRGRRVRRDERVARGRAAAPRSRTARSAATSRCDDLPTGRRARWPTARCSISAASACAISTRRMCRMAGRPACCTRRRPARCCAAICSPSSATARR